MPTLTYPSGSIFSTRLNTLTAVANIGSCSLKIELPTISYILGGQSIRYYLTQTDVGDDMTPISIGGSAFLGLRIIGSTQLAGK